MNSRAVSRSSRFDELPEVLTVQDVARFVGIGRNEEYAFAKDSLGAIRIGPRRLIVTKAALGKFLDVSNKAAAGTP
ncbi:MAG TPA: hypothetical protein VGD01_16465 [Candidatus Elarobacter sp.]